MRQTTKLKQLLHAPKLLQAPGAYDVLSARIIAMAGFETVYMTGYGTSAISVAVRKPTSGWPMTLAEVPYPVI